MRTSISRAIVLAFWLYFLVFNLAAAQQRHAFPAIHANESTAHLLLKQQGSAFSMELSTESATPVPATLRVKIVAPNEAVLSENSVAVELTSMPRRAELTLSWAPQDGLEDTATVRLLYEVVLDQGATRACTGILAPSQLIPDLFELRFMGLDAVGLGHAYTARVWATRPGSNKPVSGVALTGVFGDDDDAQAGMKASTHTNLHGEATLTFLMPEGPGAADDETLDLAISGEHNNFKNSLTAELHLWRRAGILLSTDKPLYQPEQILHMRALVLNDQHQAWPKCGMRFVVRDPDETIVYSGDAESSRFGIASAEWTIPASQKLGNYRVSAEIAGDTNSRELTVMQSVRISRYELPTFTVNVLPDQPYYLPGQNANLTVSAAYLFGKPVLRGHVRVVREESRRWNYADQKWEVEEDVVQEGDLDAKNEFHGKVNLSKEHSELQEADWKRFQDVRYAAYLTDASSRRTQERHFDLRLSRDDIHLYVLNVLSGLPSGLRPEFYISASFADGTPAVANIAGTLTSEDPSDANSKSPAVPLAVVQVRTNRHGLARIRIPTPVQPSKEHERVYLALDARTLDGRAGHHLESYDFTERDLRVTPVKSMLRPGAAIEVDVESAIPQPRVRVELIDNDTQSILASQQVNLSHPSTRVTFVPDARYSGLLTIAAYSLDADLDRYSAPSHVAAASVVIPRATRLQLEVKPAKATYRPGESASVALRVRGIQGEASQSAVGFLAYDQALEELVRTEASRATYYEDRIAAKLGFSSFPAHDDSIAGISVDDLLNRAPESPAPADLELLAESIFAGNSYAAIRVDTSDRNQQYAQAFRTQISATLSHAIQILEDNFAENGHFPASDDEFAKILAAHSLKASLLTDPWGRPYHVQRDYAWTNEVVNFRSEGPDKTLNTADDFTAWSLQRPFFEHDAKHLRAIMDAYHARTGNYIRDLPELESACAQERAPLSSFLDPWGTPYRFSFYVIRENYSITVTSRGPDKHYRSAKNGDRDSDDLPVTTLWTPYFQQTSQRINEALLADAKVTAHFPENEGEFIGALERQGIDWNALRDPWNRTYYVVPSVETIYSDKITVRAYGQQSSATTTPVTHTTRGFKVMSEGPDLVRNTADDFPLARFASPFVDETGGKDATASGAQRKLRPFYSGSSGAIRVSVTDATGAVITNAKVTASDQATNLAYTGTTNEQGLCLVGNLPPGSYRVLVESTGFRSYVLADVPVLSSNVIDLDVRLQVGATTETVEVAASAILNATSVSSLVAIARGVALTTKSGAAAGRVEMPLATPRLREYFPETLLWQPEILTDRSGNTTVKVPLADSITTWKVSVIASTIDGHIATASTDIRAFLPFFAELDPPKVLTVGDEIHLPVTVRNYLEKPQSVTLEWATEPWSQSLSSVTSHVEVPSGDYAQKDFSFRAALPMKNANQRLTAYNRSSASDSDAIEKKLRIHADGQERVAQASSFFTGETKLTLDIPPTALAGSIEAELVLYPSLIAHVSDSIEAIMERPYGCAEQTMSSAYPSLLWLQLQKSRQLPASPLDARARHYLKLAYEKLLGYREPGGGISYWGKGYPHTSLTAYALRFLAESSEFIEVDPDVLASTRKWLLQQSTADGGFTEFDWTGKPYNSSTTDITAYVVKTLAADLEYRKSTEKDLDAERQILRKAIEYLAAKLPLITDPYDVALLALAKLAAREDASKEIATLLAAQHAEGETAYWDLQRNTIFYGWGYTGRIETTAVVLDALATTKHGGHTSPELDLALNRGTLFLLKNKDRYGVWCSTQATAEVLQALIRQLTPSLVEAEKSGEPTIIFVDGKPGPELSVSTDLRQLTPQRADLTSYLSPGRHTITVRNRSAAPASVYVNSAYYLSWNDPAVAGSTVPSGDAESLRYGVKFDRTSAAVGDSIRCAVHVERVGYRGYGMVLAEVGLPPGADVDRASLDAAVESAGWEVQSYEIQPDRVVFYVWPRGGGSDFSFLLKPRFAMSAASAESILYDYYNPEARASVPPARFVIAAAPSMVTAGAGREPQGIVAH